MKIWIVKHALTKRGVYTIDATVFYEGVNKYFKNIYDNSETYTESEVCMSYVETISNVQSRKINKILSLARSISRLEKLDIPIPKN